MSVPNLKLLTSQLQEQAEENHADYYLQYSSYLEKGSPQRCRHICLFEVTNVHDVTEVIGSCNRQIALTETWFI
jgi:hypothetical protein